MNSWKEFLDLEFKKDYYQSLVSLLNHERLYFKVYPPPTEVFSAFDLTPLDTVKVVILGQDCYHGPGQAHGLSFSVKQGLDQPPSLRNIFKELKSDLGIEPPPSNCGSLVSWAKQGVLLLNSSLTVRQGHPNSHAKIGWSTLTDNAIKLLNDQDKPIVFILWGNFAKQKKSFITNTKHLVIESAHPSPFSCANFFGSKPFSKTNNFLLQNNLIPIDWEIKYGP